MKPRQSIRMVPVHHVTAHPGNVRRDLGDLDELALSIREHGILQPLVVTDDVHDRYLLLGGHRRLAAARLAGLTQVPVIIRHGLNTDDVEQLVVMLVENCQRAEINPLERAEAYDILRSQGLTLAEVARRTGVAIPTVSYYLSLLKLPLEERQQIAAGAKNITRALANAREQRQEQRLKAAGRRVGRPKGRKTTPYFSGQHHLAVEVGKRCDHLGVPKVGGIGCGPCWEAAIRADEQRKEVTP